MSERLPTEDELWVQIHAAHLLGRLLPACLQWQTREGGRAGVIHAHPIAVARLEESFAPVAPALVEVRRSAYAEGREDRAPFFSYVTVSHAPPADPPPITEDDVRTIRACAEWDEQRAKQGRNDWTPEGRAKLRALADKLAAYVPPP